MRKQTERMQGGAGAGSDDKQLEDKVKDLQETLSASADRRMLPSTRQRSAEGSFGPQRS